MFQTVAFKSYLLSLGVSDPVTKSTYGSGAKYFEKLAEELGTVLAQPLKVIINLIILRTNFRIAVG